MTTNIAKPSALPIWDINQTNIATPNSAHQNDGWPELSPGIFGKPPAEYFNYLKNLYYLWLKSIDSLTDQATADDMGVSAQATVSEVIAGTEAYKHITSLGLQGKAASSGEALAKTLTTKFLTAANLADITASDAEIIAESITNKFITPSNIAALVGSWGVPSATFLSTYFSLPTSNGQAPLQFRLIDNGRTLELIGKITKTITIGADVYTWSGLISSKSSMASGDNVQFFVFNVNQSIPILATIYYNGSTTTLSLSPPPNSGDVIVFNNRVPLDSSFI